MVKTHGFPVKKKSRENQSNDRRSKPTSGLRIFQGGYHDLKDLKDGCAKKK